MKKFRYKFPTALTVVTIIASVAIFGLSLFNILRLCEVGSLETFNPALDILSVVLCLLIFALLVSLLIFSAFKVSNKGIFLNLFFKSYKIRPDAIVTIRQERESKATALYYLSEKSGDIEFLVICVSSKEIDAFIKAVVDIAPQVKVEYFDLT